MALLRAAQTLLIRASASVRPPTMPLVSAMRHFFACAPAPSHDPPAAATSQEGGPNAASSASPGAASAPGSAAVGLLPVMEPSQDLDVATTIDRRGGGNLGGGGVKVMKQQNVVSPDRVFTVVRALHGSGGARRRPPRPRRDVRARRSPHRPATLLVRAAAGRGRQRGLPLGVSGVSGQAQQYGAWACDGGCQRLSKQASNLQPSTLSALPHARFRRRQEDAHVVNLDIDGRGTALFGIMDGHAGKEVASFAAQHMVRGRDDSSDPRVSNPGPRVTHDFYPPTNQQLATCTPPSPTPRFCNAQVEAVLRSSAFRAGNLQVRYKQWGTPPRPCVCRQAGAMHRGRPQRSTHSKLIIRGCLDLEVACWLRARGAQGALHEAILDVDAQLLTEAARPELYAYRKDKSVEQVAAAAVVAAGSG